MQACLCIASSPVRSSWMYGQTWCCTSLCRTAVTQFHRTNNQWSSYLCCSHCHWHCLPLCLFHFLPFIVMALIASTEDLAAAYALPAMFSLRTECQHGRSCYATSSSQCPLFCLEWVCTHLWDHGFMTSGSDFDANISSQTRRCAGPKVGTLVERAAKRHFGCLA